jgi:hypothetical protein
MNVPRSSSRFIAILETTLAWQAHFKALERFAHLAAAGSSHQLVQKP